MRTRTWGILGVTLIVIGIVGAVVTAIVLGSTATSPNNPTRAPGMRGPQGNGNSGSGSFANVGERIYKTGVGSDGQPIRRTGGFGMMANGGCVNCHGWDGRGGRIGGGMMGQSQEVPDIRYSTLTTDHSEGTESDPAWTDSEIENAIREGKEPNGESLSQVMPRWDMSDSDVKDVIAYLKELD